VGFLRFSGGANVPLADGTWSQSIKTSPKIGVGIGGMYRDIGAGFTADVAAARVAASENLFAIDASNQRVWEVRLLGHVLYNIPDAVQPNVGLGFRAGAGADLAIASYDRIVFGNNNGKSFTKTGFALELGAAAWWHAATGVEIGIETAIPLSFHSSETAPGGATGFNYTSVGVDILIGARFSSRD